MFYVLLYCVRVSTTRQYNVPMHHAGKCSKPVVNFKATMSKTSRSFEQVSQHFRCPVHLGKLKDPRRLPCDHTLCSDCLKNLIKSVLKRSDNRGIFNCPECRAGHHIPVTETEDWADWFPVDAFCVIQLQTLARFQDSQVCEVNTRMPKISFRKNIR